MGAIFTALGTMGAIIALGWVLGRRGTLGPAAPAVLARVVFTVATPCLLVVTVGSADLHLLVSRSALVTALSTTVVATIAVLVMRGLWRRSAGDVTVAVLAASYVNAGNLGLPIAVYLLGDALAVVPTMLYQQLILASLAFAVLDARPITPVGIPADTHTSDHTSTSTKDAAHAFAAAETETDDPSGPVRRSGTVREAFILRNVAARTLHNPIIVGSLSGLVLAALPWRLPDVVFGPFSLIGAAAAPIALLTFGMSLAVPRTGAAMPVRRELVLVTTLRSVIHPILAVTIGTALGLGGHALLAVTAMAALPTAQNVLVYAIQYGRQEPLARDAGLATTVLAVPVLLIIAALLS